MKDIRRLMPPIAMAIVAFSVLPSLLSGCGEKPAEQGGDIKTTTKTVNSDWTRVSNDKAGIALRAPKGWQAFDLSSSDFSKMLDQMAATDPNVARSAPQIKQLAASGIYKMFVIRTDYGGKKVSFSDNINIVAQDLPSSVSLDTLVEQSILGMASASGLKGTDFTKESAQVAGRDCRIVKGGWKLTTAGGPIDVELRSYHFVDDKRLVVVTGSTVKDRIAELEPVFRQIVDTLELNKPE